MATYWVSATGSDATGDGLSKATAWGSTAHAIANSSDGDIIMLANGTYDWSQNAGTTSGPWQFDAARTFRAETVGGVIFDGQMQEVYSAVGQPAVQTLLEGIHFRNAKTYTSSYKGCLAVVNDEESGGQAIFDRCIFEKMGYHFNNDIFHSGSAYHNSRSVLLRGCLLKNMETATTASGAYRSILKAIGPKAYYRLHNCTIVVADNTPEKVSTVIMASEGVGGQLIEIINCIIYSSVGQLDLFAKRYPGTQWPHTWRLRSTCLYGVTKNAVGATVVDETNVLENTDPLFIDVAGGNYNLAPGSPCIDSGEII